ncbi:ABC transporter ATP-binding protein, partial [Bradyrhizobium sp.]
MLSSATTRVAETRTEARGCALMLQGVGHSFGATVALESIDLAVARGELIALLGPSGCGKTTLLQIIAGFLQPSRGAVSFDGVRIDRTPANRRRIGMVFQNYALFPHLTVAENVAYGLRARKSPGAMVKQRVAEMLARVQMTSFGDRFPRQLSGGQQQRVALARALAIDPVLVLLDEPFSALDKNLRLDMQIEIKSLLKSCGVTSIMVTHDQEEALSMADRIVVLNKGRIEQIDTPDALYDAPASLFVNGFIGHANFLKGRTSPQ